MSIACHRDAPAQDESTSAASRPSTPETEPEKVRDPTTTSVVIQEGRALTLRVAGATLEIPANAIEPGVEVTLSVSPVADSDFPQMAAGYQAATDIFTVRSSANAAVKGEPIILAIDSPEGFAELAVYGKFSWSTDGEPAWGRVVESPTGKRWPIRLFALGETSSLTLSGRRL